MSYLDQPSPSVRPLLMTLPGAFLGSCVADIPAGLAATVGKEAPLAEMLVFFSWFSFATWWWSGLIGCVALIVIVLPLSLLLPAELSRRWRVALLAAWGFVAGGGVTAWLQFPVADPDRLFLVGGIYGALISMIWAAFTARDTVGWNNG